MPRSLLGNGSRLGTKFAQCNCTVQLHCAEISVFLAGVKDGEFDDLVVIKNPAPGCADAPAVVSARPARAS